MVESKSPLSRPIREILGAVFSASKFGLMTSSLQQQASLSINPWWISIATEHQPTQCLKLRRALLHDRFPDLPTDEQFNPQWPRQQLGREDRRSWYVAAVSSANAFRVRLIRSNFTIAMLTSCTGHRLARKAAHGSQQLSTPINQRTRRRP